MADVKSNWLSRYLANPIVKEYTVQYGDNSLYYSETMTEIKLCIDVALQMIQLFKIDDSEFHSIFQQINNKFEAFDKKSLEIENRMVKYNQRLHSTSEFASKYQRYFKRSKDREMDCDEFIPINVHLQNFNVGKLNNYKTVSCGAAAAHTKGFKGSNGLWQHLETTVDEEIPSEDFGRNVRCLRYQRHCIASIALLNLSSQWCRILQAIDRLKLDEMSVDEYISTAKALLSTIIESIRAEIDDQSVQNIRESARMSADIIKNCHSALSPSEFAQTTKVALQKAYTECLEFLIFRALPVMLSDEQQQRVDIVQSNIIAISVAAILAKVSSSESPNELIKLRETGLLVNFESLLSEYGKETGMMADYAFGALILLERASFVLTPEVCELTIEGNRLAPRILIPCMPELLVGDFNGDGKVEIEFNIVPIFINIGINEKQSLTDAMHKEKNGSLIDDINKISLYKLFNWVQTNLSSEDANILLNGKMQQLKEEIYARKKKNVLIHKITSCIIRDLGGSRVINCKSGKDRTGMAVTLEQARFLTVYGLHEDGIVKCLAEMRAQGVRRDNCRKNQDRYLYAFTGIQLQTFPTEYRPPKGSYGHAET